MGLRIQDIVSTGFSTVGKTMPFAVTTAVPISMISMGAYYVKDCPSDVMIPIYMIIMGVLSLVRFVISVVMRAKDWGDVGKRVNRYTRVADIILFAWFITGCVFIYRAKDDFQSLDSTADDFCDYTFYWYSFWITTSGFLVLAVCLIVAGGVIYYNKEKDRLEIMEISRVERFNDLGITSGTVTHPSPWLPVISNTGLAVITIIPISNVVMGAMYVDDCPAETMIPIYLIVVGLVTVFRNVLSLVFRCRDPDNMEDISLITLGITVLIFGWFIAGCVFIYRTKDDFQSTDSKAGDFCDYTFYWYSFWITTSGFLFALFGIAYLAVLYIYF